MKQFRNFVFYILPILVCVVIVALYNFWDNKHITEIEYSLIKKNNSDTTYLMARSHKGVLVKIHEYHYFTDYVIIGNLNNVEKIISKDGEYKVDINNLREIKESHLINVADTFKGKPMYSINSSLPFSKSKLPYVNQFINWDGDVNYFAKTFLHPLVIFIALLIFIITFLCLPKKHIQLQPLHNSFNFKQSFLVTLILVTIGFAIKIVQDQYYFLQDDNYAQFTPVLLQGLNDWYTNGTIPTYNPYQCAGVPTTEFSTYAFFYPITHVSYCLAKFGLDNQLHFNNVFAFLHFVGAAFFMLKIFYYYKANQFLAIVGTLAYVLCGFSLEVTRSWYYTTPTVLFLPLFIWLAARYSDKTSSIKQQISLGIIITIFAYSGNFQFFTYTILFSFCFFIFNSEKKILFNIKQLLIPFILTSILFAPQLIMTLIATAGNDRNGSGGASTLTGVTSFFLPFVFGKSNNYFWGQPELVHYAHYLYHGPFLFLFTTLVFSTVKYLKKYSNQPSEKTPTYLRLLILFFFIALGLSFGRNFILWPIHSNLPLFNKFTIPFKFIIFLQFFGTVSGVILFSQLIKNKKLVAGATIISFAVAFISICNTHDALSMYPRFHNNYPKFNFFETIQKDSLYRTASFTIMRSMNPEYNKTLDNNLATMQQIQHIEGYEPLFNNKVNIDTFINEMSIKYFIVSHFEPSRPLWYGDSKKAIKYSSLPNVDKIYEDSSVTVYRNNNALPIVAAYDSVNNMIPLQASIHNNNNGVTINLKNVVAAKKIILSYNYIKGLNVKANGKNVTTTTDAANRVLFYPSEPIKNITTTYKPPPFN